MLLYKKTSIVAIVAMAVVTLILSYQASAQSILNVIETRKIYDNNSYCAFTGLTSFNGKYYCTFREASSHRISFDDSTSWGRIVLLKSEDAKNWEKVAEFKQDSTDLRDPKILTTPDSKNLMLLYHKHRIYKNRIGGAYSVVRIFKDELAFYTDEQELMVNGYSKKAFVLWNATLYKKSLYGFVCGEKFMLVKSKDGVNYEEVSDCSDWAIKHNSMNESNIVFSGRKAYSVVRSGDDQGFWGESRYPFKKWDWKKMNISVGGPNLYLLNRRTFLLGCRYYGNDNDMGKTVVYYLDKSNGPKAEVGCFLESTGNSSYPCFLKVNKNRLIVSYYSGDSKKSNIYISNIDIK